MFGRKKEITVNIIEIFTISDRKRQVTLQRSDHKQSCNVPNLHNGRLHLRVPAHTQVVIGTEHGDFFLVPSVLFSQGKLRTQTRHLQ